MTFVSRVSLHKTAARCTIFVASLVCAIVAATATAQVASAACGTDCHGTTLANISTVQGGIAYINTSSMTNANLCTAFIDSEMWLGTTDSTFNYWIEQGITKGYHQGGTCGNGAQFFWADNRPNGGGYNEHYPGGSVGFNTTYTYKIMFDNGTTYEVDRNGTNIGYSNGSICCGGQLEAGAEANTNNDTVAVSVSGEASSLQKEVSNTWSYNWTGASVYNPEGYFSMSGYPDHDEFYSH